MSSSNITHHKTRTSSHSDMQTNVDEHLGAKNEVHNKNMDAGKKRDSIVHTTVHGIKDSMKHVPANPHMKKAHSGNEFR